MATGAAKPAPTPQAGGQPAWQRLAPLAVAFALGVAAGCTLLGRAALAPSATHLLPHACHAPAPAAARSGGSSLPERHANVTALYESYAHMLEGVVTARVFPEQGSCADLECSGVGPMNFAGRFGGGDWPPQGLTMVGTCRIWNIKEAIEHVVAAGVEGDFVELGAWRGGASLYARAMLNALGQGHRQVHVFDAWDALQQYIIAKAYMTVPVARVEGYFSDFGLTEGTHFVKGLFKDTLPEWRAQHEGRKVAILRVDGNLYSSHQSAFYNFYDMVPVGGVVIMDDIRSHAGAQEAWADFQRDQGFTEKVVPVNERWDAHGGWFIKSKEVVVDFSKKHELAIDE